MRRDAKLYGAASATGRNTSRDHQEDCLHRVLPKSASSKHNCPYCSDVAPWVDQNRQSLTIGQLYDI